MIATFYVWQFFKLQIMNLFLLKHQGNPGPRWLLGLPAARSWVQLSFVARQGVRFTHSFIVLQSVQTSLTLLSTKVAWNSACNHIPNLACLANCQSADFGTAPLELLPSRMIICICTSYHGQHFGVDNIYTQLLAVSLWVWNVNMFWLTVWAIYFT